MLQKEQYVSPNLLVIYYEAEDVVRTSVPVDGGNMGDWWGNEEY